MKASFQQHDPKGIVKYHCAKVIFRVYTYEVAWMILCFKVYWLMTKWSKELKNIKEMEVQNRLKYFHEDRMTRDFEAQIKEDK